MVGWLNSDDVKEETPVVYDDFDPLKEWLVDPDPVQLQNSCDCINFNPEPCALHYSEVEIKQEVQILEPSIDLKMEKFSLLENLDVPKGDEIGLEKNVGGNDGEINCLEPGFEGLKSNKPLSCKEMFSEGEYGDEERSTSNVAEFDCKDSSSKESSSYESSSNKSSSDESSSDESSSIAKSVSEDGDELEIKWREETVEFEEGEVREVDASEIDFLSDEEEGPKGPIRSKHEVEDLPQVPKVDVLLQPHHQLSPVGFILSVMLNRVIIEGSVRHNPLDEGSILWLTDARSPLGLVDETFGPVKNPFYVVRYNSEEEVPAGARVNTPVSFVPEFATQILNQKDLYNKGYDASGDNDEEDDNDLDFSDDEKEAEYRKSLRQGKRVAKDTKGMKQDIRTDRKRTTTLPRIQHKEMKKQQTFTPSSIDQPLPANPAPPRPAVFMRQSGISPRSWNPTTSNLLAPSGMPKFPQPMQGVGQLGNPSRQLNAGLIAPSRMPEFPRAMRPVSFLGNSSQQLLTRPQEASSCLPPGFSPQMQNVGFQGDLQLQLQSQNLLLNNLVNMVALQQQLQQLIPQQGSNLPWFGAASSQQTLGQSNFAPPQPPQPPLRPPFVNGFLAPGTQGQASSHFAPFMQFNAGNSSSLSSNGGNPRSHGRTFHRGGGRFFGRGGRQPNR